MTRHRGSQHVQQTPRKQKCKEEKTDIIILSATRFRNVRWMVQYMWPLLYFWCSWAQPELHSRSFNCNEEGVYQKKWGNVLSARKVDTTVLTGPKFLFFLHFTILFYYDVSTARYIASHVRGSHGGNNMFIHSFNPPNGWNGEARFMVIIFFFHMKNKAGSSAKSKGRA